MFLHQANHLNPGWDVHTQARVAATQALDQDFTNRENWWILSGKVAAGPPVTGEPAFLNNRFLPHSLNKFLFPHLLKDKEFMDHFKVFSYQKVQSYCFDIIQMSRQSFLSWMGLYVQPFWDVGGPAGGRRKMHRVTPEGLLV